MSGVDWVDGKCVGFLEMEEIGRMKAGFVAGWNGLGTVQRVPRVQVCRQRRLAWRSVGVHRDRSSLSTIVRAVAGDKAAGPQESHGDGGNRDDGIGGGNDGGGDEWTDDDGMEDNDENKQNVFVHLFQLVMDIFSGLLDTVLGSLGSIPAQAIVGVTAIITTLLNQYFTRRREERGRQEKINEQRRNEEKEVRETMGKFYQRYTEPLLKAAAKLQDHLYIYNSLPHAATNIEEDAKYGAYLVGRYFCFVEIFKKASPSLSFGRPKSDRIFSNILGRLQVIFAMEDRELSKIYGLKFVDSECNLSGILTSYQQAAIGACMTRSRYKKYASTEDIENATDAGLHYTEFCELLETDPNFAKYFQPLIKGSIEMMSHAEGFRTNRITLLQATLVDLIDFLDPAPKCAIIPAFRRRRIPMANGALYHGSYPKTLQKVYDYEAQQRDGTFTTDTGDDKTLIDVFVSGPTGLGSRVNVHHNNGVGDCPYSHRVLLTLEEMGLKYNLVTVDRNMRPFWYYNLHPEGRVPVISHDGTIIEESTYIVKYLQDAFKRRGRLATRKNLSLDPFPVIETFRSNFIKFIQDEKNKPLMDDGLQTLEKTLRLYTNGNHKKPFLGGNRLSEEDVALMPYLYHMEIVGERIRNFKMDKKVYPTVANYMEAMHKYPRFAKTKANPDHLMYGYLELERGVMHNETRRVSDILE